MRVVYVAGIKNFVFGGATVGFWIFMLICDLLIPLSMIAFGSRFVKGAPKTINTVFGYRTSMSMKNRDTWEFAHKHNGKLWRMAGWFTFVASAAAMLFVIGKDENTVGMLGGIVSGVQLVVIIVSIFPTEAALRKKFDENGLRRE